MNSITPDMKYRQSLLTYAQKYGVSRASRKYNKSRSYISFWRARYDGSLQSLACQSRRPHSHPNQHTQEELKLIADMHRRNPQLGIVELWARIRKRGYARTIESLWRVMRREGWTTQAEKKKPYKPKPYEQMQYPGQRVQIDVKVVPPALYCRPAAKAVSVHRHRRVFPLSRPGRLRGTERLFLRRLSKQGRQAFCSQRRCRRVCSDR